MTKTTVIRSYCERYCESERHATYRARIAEHDGRVVVVVGVPIVECLECGEVWLTLEVAKRLDGLFDQLLSSGAEVAYIHWDQPKLV